MDRTTKRVTPGWLARWFHRRSRSRRWLRGLDRRAPSARITRHTNPLSASQHRHGFLAGWSQLVVAGGTTLALLMMALCAWSLFQSRQDAFQFAEASLKNVGVVAQRDIERNFELYALSLDAATEAVQAPEVMQLPPALQRQVIFDGATTAQYLGSMLVLDAQGDILIDSEHVIPRPGNFADRDYFLAQREDSDAGLFISDPLRGRLNHGGWEIALSRRISGPGGVFAGVVVMTVQVDYFQHLFEGLDLGPDSAISLMKSNGTVVMREPMIAGVIGQTMGDSPPFKYFDLSNSEHAFVGRSTMDGASRLYAFRRVGRLPLVIAVAESLDHVYASWKRRAWLIGSLILLSGASFIVLSFTLGSQLRRRMNAELELEVMAHTDGLTGLNNRHTLSDILNREWRLAQLNGHALSLLFVDIDHFKAFNDHYGHQAGDSTLVAVAHAIVANIRKEIDHAARYGGEEFVVVLPGTGPVAASAVASKLLHAVRALEIAHDDSPTGNVVTVSIGVASWSAGNFATINALIKAADDALYQAKANGRNRTVAARSPADL